MLTRRRSRWSGGVAGALIGLLALLGASAGSGARAAGAGDAEPTLSEEYLNERIAPRIGQTWVQAEATPPRLALTGSPAGPDQLGNSILAVSSEVIDLGGRTLGEGDLTTPSFPLIEDVVPGVPSWFDGQLTLLAVTGWVETSPDLVDAEIAEVSIAFALPDFDRLEESPFAVEPNADRSINVSVGSLGGELRPGQTFVSGGSFVLSTPTIPVSAGYTDQGWLFNAILPGTATDVRVIVGASTDGTPESLAVSWADVPDPTTVAQLTGAPFDPFAVQEALGLVTKEVFVEGVPGDEVTDELSDDAAGEIEDEIDGEGDLADEIEDGTGDDVLDDTDSAATEEPGSPPLEADEDTDSDPAAGGQTVDDEAGDSESADVEGGDPADGDGGGSLLWVLLLLGGTAVGATLAWLLWKRAHGDDSLPTPTADPTTGEKPTGTEPTGKKPTGTAPTGSTGNDGPSSDGPVAPAGGATPTEDVPVPAGPLPVSECDWELWFGATPLKRAAPGHRVCCVYRMGIESIPLAEQQGAFFAGAEDDRVRIPGFRSTGKGLGFDAQATTRTEPDDGTHREDAFERLAAVPERAAQGAPGGLPPDVAAHLTCGETTTVSITLVSKCVDHRHEYHGTAVSRIDLTAAGLCSNTEPGDRCDVWLRVVSDGSAGVSGDLDVGASGGVDLAGDANDADGARQLDRHEHQRDGRPNVIDTDSGTDGPSVKQGFVWSATFSNEFALDAAQIVPISVRTTTDEVETRSAGGARHDLSLAGTTTARSCAGTTCGCGATACGCDPEFVVVIDAEKQELVAGGQRWTLSRAPGGTGHWTAS